MTAWAVYTLYAAFVLGGCGLYLMLPNPSRGKPLAGAALGLLGLAALLVVWLAGLNPAGSSGVFFYILASVAIACAVRVITHPKPVYCALYFVIVVLATAALCLLQSAEFVAVAMVIIYAGAILVTYVFVIMLAQQGGSSFADVRSREPFLSVAAGFLTLAVISVHAAQATPQRHATSDANRANAALAHHAEHVTSVAAGDEAVSNPSVLQGQVSTIGGAVMTRYVVVLQLSGLLLLIAMIGAVAMSRKRVPQEGVTPPRAPLGQAGREVAPF
ncbi:MAG: NADH-quinone oxidoreductase subunit J [Phycisphaerales bacterium]|nr:NADH-quinone oxidoreductase subunit J [Phycisphaerales bacterium]